MKAMVWTKWHPSKVDGKPKCVFIGDIPYAPRVGEYITLQDGYASETVRTVAYDFVSSELEIGIESCDPENIYGPCLFHAEVPK